MASSRGTIASASTAATLVPWVNGGLESLWLLTVVLVPLAFVGRGDMASEALIAFVEVPKIALLRTLVGLMAILWLVEWGLQGKLPFVKSPFSKGGIPRPRPFLWLSGLGGWLKEQPTRWVILAVYSCLGATLISTIFSTSFSVSLWGEVPGQDSYAAYTVIAYILLFGVIVTHLKSRPQLWRLLGALVVIGVLVGGYGVLQGSGHDFFDLMDPAERRVTSTTGNAVFAGAALVMTTPISLVLAAINLQRPVRTAGFWWRVVLWVIVLAVQLLGIIFTFSRGPWLGLALALLVFLGLGLVFSGWRGLVRISLALGLLAALILALVLVPFWLRDDGTGPSTTADSTAAEVAERFASVSREVAGKGLSGRTEIWRGSWQLILHRPWFEFQSLSLPWLRQVIGYGPDLFRYTYLLQSPPIGEERLPLEPDQAHNYFIHQGVELGFLGLLSSLGIFVVLFLVGGNQLLQGRRTYSVAHNLLLISLLATFAGRTLEQLVGVARVSDLTLFWALLAVFAALPSLMRTPEAATEPSPPRRRGIKRPALLTPTPDGQLFWRLAVVAWLMGGIGMLTWVKTINYSRAAAIAADGGEYFRHGEFQTSLKAIDRAIDLAPDVATYYNHKATIYSAYRANNRVTPERECSLQLTGLSYEECLAQRTYISNRQAVGQRPLYFRSHVALAESTLSLAFLMQSGELAQEAAQHYKEAVALLPGSWQVRNQLARTYLAMKQPEVALPTLEASLAITKGTAKSAEAFFIQGQAYRDLGDLGQAAQSLELGLALEDGTAPATQAHASLAEIYTALGNREVAEKHQRLYQELRQP